MMRKSPGKHARLAVIELQIEAVLRAEAGPFACSRQDLTAAGGDAPIGGADSNSPEKFRAVKDRVEDIFKLFLIVLRRKGIF